MFITDFMAFKGVSILGEALSRERTATCIVKELIYGITCNLVLDRCVLLLVQYLISVCAGTAAIKR